jgi:hypothetical protein
MILFFLCHLSVLKGGAELLQGRWTGGGHVFFRVILNEFCSRFVMAVPFILPSVRRSYVGSFVERDFFIIILFQVYFDFA